MGECKGFFAGSGSLRPDDKSEIWGGSGESTIPQEWIGTWFLSRPVWEGLCTWTDLDRITMSELMEMHKSLNLKDYLELNARQQAEQEAARIENENSYR